MSHVAGKTRREDFPRPTSTAYLADYEYIAGASQIAIIRQADVTNADEFRRKLWWLDAWNEQHLPSGSDQNRRVARDRHGKMTNCAFADGPSAKLNSMEMSPYDWGVAYTGSTP